MFGKQCSLTNKDVKAYIRKHSWSNPVWIFKEQCGLKNDNVNVYMEKHSRWNSVWGVNKQCARSDAAINEYIRKLIAPSQCIWNCNPLYFRYGTWDLRKDMYCSRYNIFVEGPKINEALKSKLIVAEDMRPEVEITNNGKHVCVSDRDFDVFFDLVNAKLDAAKMKAAEKAKIVKDAIWHKIFTILVTGPQMPLM